MAKPKKSKAQASRRAPLTEATSDSSVTETASDSEITADFQGSTLMGLLNEVGNTRGLSNDEIATAIGVTYSHYMLLKKGQREPSKLKEEPIAKCTAFLGLPRVVVMLAAGQLKLEDFYQDPPLLDSHLEQSLKFVQRDRLLGPFMPGSIFTADVAIRRYVVLLYEAATGKTLIPSRRSIEEIVASYRELEQSP